MNCKDGHLVSYNKPLPKINSLKASGTRAFSLLNEMHYTSPSNGVNFKGDVHLDKLIKLILSFLKRTVNVRGESSDQSLGEHIFLEHNTFCVWHTSTHPTIFSMDSVLSGVILSGSLEPWTQHQKSPAQHPALAACLPSSVAALLQLLALLCLYLISQLALSAHGILCLMKTSCMAFPDLSTRLLSDM